MTTSNEIKLDHIRNFFSLNGEVEQLNIAPSATGGTGINNSLEFPPPKPCISVSKKKETNYVQKYLQQAKTEMERRQSQSMMSLRSSNMSVNDLEDVEDASTAIGDLPEVSELEEEKLKQLYETYYSVPNRVYDQDLNVTNYREEILQLMEINPVLIIEGPTGCGKTTQVPQYILDYHATKGKHCNIVVTQPRKIAAISIAQRVCQERGWQLGSIVGYQVAMDPKVSADTRLCYMTTGVLLEKLVSAKSMDKFTHVIIDEVHERDQDIDFALLLVKKFLMNNSQHTKVILMSATFDTSMFAQYFALSANEILAPIVEICGKTKEVTEHYLHELRTLVPIMPEFDMYEPAIETCLYDTVVQLMSVFDRIEKAEQNAPPEMEYAPSRGAVLIFLPGYDEISTLSDKLSAARLNKKYWVIPLHSMITLAEQSKVFREPPQDHRKVIISTNIAESSITVPDVKYVIDFCLTKSLVTDPQTNYTCLQLEWASKANCTQRKGRAGRVDIGKVYRMVPKGFYEQFVEYSTPEIKRCPLTSTILHLKRLEVCEPQEMLAFALDPPYLLDIENAILQLKEALALYGKGSRHDGELTFIGQVMSTLPLDIKLSKLILFGYAFSCLEECIIIAACLSLQSFFAKPFQKLLESYRSRLSWSDYTFSDCFAYLNAYQIWKKHTAQSFFLKPGGMKENAWGEKHYIQIRRIKEVDKLVTELKARLERHNIYLESHRRVNDDAPTSDMILKIVIAGAFYPHYFVQQKLDEKEVLREVNENDPLSTVVVSGLPPNHGLLYACALQNMLACCSDKINIDFEERKAYIKFERYDSSTKAAEMKLPALSVNLAVYLAVKMRLLRIPLDLSVYSFEEAESKMKQIVQLKKSKSTQLVSHRFSVKLNPVSIIQRVNMPPPHISLISIFPTHINSCGHFWARYLGPESDNHYAFIRTTICNVAQNKGFKPLPKKAEVNMMVLAPYRSSPLQPFEYYRAQVRDIKHGMVTVLFIDYGNEETMKEEELKESFFSMPDFITTPAQAFECFLSEVKPSAGLHHLGVWSKEANTWFRKTVDGQALRAKVYSVLQDSIRLEILMTQRDGAVVSLNRRLINMGYAVPAEETLMSRQNHELRDKCQEERNVALCSDIGFSALEVSMDDVKDLSDRISTRNRIRLKGPSNPLEVSYIGLTHMDRAKVVKVERDSVNSVSFNAEPQDPYTSMLVAASLSIGQKSNSVSARDTTLMPKILGLPSLLCLLFSPTAEIRTDKVRTCYTGALCGLGFDPETGEPLNTDHDIELEFDIEFTVEDFADINAIRMGLNMLLRPKDENSANIADFRRQLRKCMIDLLKKRRTMKEPCFYHKSGRWNQIDCTKLLQPVTENSTENPHVLPLHKLTNITPPTVQ